MRVPWLAQARRCAYNRPSENIAGNLFRAGIAQSVEQRIRNAKVGGSTPLSGTIRSKHLAKFRRWAFLLSGAPVTVV